MGSKKTLVIGLGNPLLGDDGAGVELVERWGELFLDEDVEVMDGGTQGLYLLPYLEGRPHVIIVDAVHFNAVPGTLVKLRADEVPAVAGLKLSEHQTSLKDVFALLQLMDEMPGEMVVIGVQPASLEWGAPLSPEVQAALPEMADAVAAQLKAWRREDQRHVTYECTVRLA